MTQICCIAAIGALSFSLQPELSGFSTIINIPEDMPTISGGIGSDTQLNLSDDGVILSDQSNRFEIGPPDGSGSNIEVNITAGEAGDFIHAYSGSTVNISGGRVGNAFFSAGPVTLSGGKLGQDFQPTGPFEYAGGVIGRGISATSPLANVTLVGDLFTLNDAPASPGDTFNINIGSTLSGIASDGTPFVFTSIRGDLLLNPIDLEIAELPPIDTTPVTINAGHWPEPGIARGQTLTVEGTASLADDFIVYDASLRVEGGTVGEYLMVVAGGDLSASGGTFGNQVNILAGGSADISGGNFQVFRVERNATMNFSGGQIDVLILAGPDSPTMISGGTITELRPLAGPATITGGEILSPVDVVGSIPLAIAGGTFGDDITVSSTADVSGGTFLGDLIALNGSNTNFYGSGFILNGTPVEGLAPGETVEFSGTEISTLSCVLADGSEFVLTPGSVFTGAATISFTFIPCDTDLTTTAATLPGSAGYAVPDGVTDLDDLGYFIVAWLDQNLAIADLTTSGSTLPTAERYAIPDGIVDLDDLGYFLNGWLNGCP
ncbi:MAG: GC-type dockerin domain-anchored protein [Planctomycetota bacterium]